MISVPSEIFSACVYFYFLLNCLLFYMSANHSKPPLFHGKHYKLQPSVHHTPQLVLIVIVLKCCVSCIFSSFLFPKCPSWQILQIYVRILQQQKYASAVGQNLNSLQYVLINKYVLCRRLSCRCSCSYTWENLTHTILQGTTLRASIYKCRKWL